ncbi:MAG: hypothetical protein K5930_10485 [Treponemataceae bacterium]|nr:hypothetical protein [Treponemataceae bacterium]
MSLCERFVKCPFYQDKMVIETGVGSILKKKYCESNKHKCARYKVLCELGPEYVDNTLFPYMKDRALELIQLNKNDAEALEEDCFVAVLEPV